MSFKEAFEQFEAEMQKDEPRVKEEVSFATLLRLVCLKSVMREHLIHSNLLKA